MSAFGGRIAISTLLVLAIMRTLRVSTMQELMDAEPEAMRTFL